VSASAIPDITKNQGDVLQRPPGAKNLARARRPKKKSLPHPPVRKSTARCASVATPITSATERPQIYRKPSGDVGRLVLSNQHIGAGHGAEERSAHLGRQLLAAVLFTPEPDRLRDPQPDERP